MVMLKKLISKFDIYSIGVQLNFKQQEKQKSFFGGVVSLFTFTLIGFTMWFYSKETILRQSPIIIQSFREVVQAERIYVDKDNIILMVGIQNGLSKSFVDNTVFSLKASIQQLNITTDPHTGIQTRQLITQQRQITLCNENDIKKESVSQYFSKVNLKMYYCLQSTENTPNFIEGGFDQNKFSQMYIYVQKCRNSTSPNGVICKSQEEIDQIMSNTKLSLYMSDQMINPINFEQPFQDKGINQYAIISSKFQKEIQLYYQNSYIETDFGYFNKDIQQTRGFSFSGLTEVQISDDPAIICRILLRIQRQKEAYMTRRYSRILDIAAQIGGLIKVITLFGALFTKHFQRFQYHQRVVNEIFSFTKEENRIENAIEEANNNIRTRNQSLDLKIIARDKSLINNYDQNDKSYQRRGGNYLKQVMRVFKVTKEAMKYKFTDYIYHYFYPKQAEIQYKKPLLDFSKRKLLENLDIIYILNKLIEIDKLKYILFDEDQLKLFEFIPKPQITLSDTVSQSQISQKTLNSDKLSQSQQKQIKVPKFYFDAHKTLVQKADDGKQSLIHILNKPQKSMIDKKLLNSVDSTLLEINSQIDCKGIVNSAQSPVTAAGIDKVFNFSYYKQQDQNQILDEVFYKKGASTEKSQFFEMVNKEKDPIVDQTIQIILPSSEIKPNLSIFPIMEQNTITEGNFSMRQQTNNKIEDLQSESSDVINPIKDQLIFLGKSNDNFNSGIRNVQNSPNNYKDKQEN